MNDAKQQVKKIIQEFGKNICTRCSIEKIEYVDENGATKVIDCYFKQGSNNDKSKDLVEICNDLGMELSAKVKLQNLRCWRLNAIEGLWCNQKAFVSSHTDQSFEKMIKLIADSRIHFAEQNIAVKLFERFWRSIEAYLQG
ncbi:unnamed protein product [Rotaria sordida]|uniref:Uncharacterized protein n=1 Tax=Rotaria sordida TaxID=392033 RepID=A0A815HT60_9BILA|nr:unnamed protein product [Rotaria sordida]CAF1323891.1 unnamed protein product [Rotaria sordida]CAF1355903.1 unnamed protein product [Rotaria sordida]CAF1587427.1 unnamed protein product [Rotaria sordida]CAF1587441.1 unnamed protein product [Rotaria sordida]